MSEWEASRLQELAELRGEWGDSYQIDWAFGQFRARRRDTHASTLAKSKHHLIHLLEEDFRASANKAAGLDIAENSVSHRDDQSGSKLESGKAAPRGCVQVDEPMVA